MLSGLGRKQMPAAAAGPSGGPGGSQQGRSPLAVLGTGPLSRLQALLPSLVQFALDDEDCVPAAAVIVSIESVRLALLRLSLAAAALAPREVLGEGLARQGRGRVAAWTQLLATRLLRDATTAARAGVPAAALQPFVGFARAMLRLRLLHAASRQLATFEDALGLTWAVAREAAAELPEAAEAAPPAAAAAAAGGGQRSWWEEVGRSPDGDNAVEVMLSTAYMGYALVLFVCDLPGICGRHWATLPAAAAGYRVLAVELLSALEDSAFLDHAARVQLLLAQLAPSLNTGGGGVGGDNNSGQTPAGWQQQLHLAMDACRASTARLTVMGDTVAGGPPHPVLHGGAAVAAVAERASDTIQQVLSGRCVHTAQLCFGVAALCSADGGPAYGLPPQLLTAAAALYTVGDEGEDEGGAGAGAGGGGGGGGEAAGGGGVGPGRMSANVYASVSMLLPRRTQPAPPGRRAACALALRIGRLAMASLPPAELEAEAAVEAQAAAVEAEAVALEAGAPPRPKAGRAVSGGGRDCGGSAGSGGSGRSGGSSAAGGTGIGRGVALRVSAAATATRAAPSGGGGGGGNSSNAAAVAAPTGVLTQPGAPQVMAPEDAASLCCRALSAARQQLQLQLRSRGGARDSVPWRADAAECWRLATAAVRHALSCADEDVLVDLANSLLWLWCETVRAPPNPDQQPLSDDAPPPLVAAALDAGLLPCLERMLRRAALAPDGPEAALFCRVFGSMCRHNYAVMALLLAHGEPQQAAALVATLAKLVRTTDPLVVTAAWAPEQDRQQCALKFVCWTMQNVCSVHALHLGMLQEAARAGAGAAGAGLAAAAPGSGGPPCTGVAGDPSTNTAGSASETAPSTGPGPGPGTGCAASSAPGTAGPSRTMQQLGRLSTLALATVLLPLGRLALPALQEGLRQQRAAAGRRPPRLAQVRGGLGSLVPALLTSLSLLAPMCAGDDDALAAAEGAGGSGAATRAGWRSLLLEEVSAMELLGAALELMAAGDDWEPQPLRGPEAGQHAAGHEEQEEGQGEGQDEGQEDKDGVLPVTRLVTACRAVAAVTGPPGTIATPAREGLDRGPVQEATAPGGAVLGASGSAAGTGAAAAAAAAADMSRSGTGGGLVPSPPWRPELLRAVAGRLRAAGDGDWAVKAEELAARLDGWDSGGQPGGRDGEGGAEGRAAADNGKVSAAQVAGLGLGLGGTPPPLPAAARRLLRTCANPGCANLEGDSEAGLALWACGGGAGPGGSGAAADELYCCRSCNGLEWLQ
ncbi:hypothetical protein GPECTOR_20g551 [Gonium pectorale]|uniref:MYND-type domain-containing protein n=1 Tax=Gonium pectorale TaxID=33097 RepID=A0A150GIT6_GONPE|nr:hypothetical protein GPECTOR_20g551 [Gonium pectorale]|eukprot:KXZ49694.1 hypothetical protein GPECTOR_20g551 [Gonium pectorale]